MKLLLLAAFLFSSLFATGQDVIVLDGSGKNLNHSIADQFTIYSSTKPIQYGELNLKSVRDRLTKTKLSQSVENLDFTSDYYYIWFNIKNKSGGPKYLYLETARPITNLVKILPLREGYLEYTEELQSGDAIPFEEKAIHSNNSILPLYIPADKEYGFILSLSSDGEIISLPMIFWEGSEYEKIQNQRQFSSGIFYGIFVFVILIYFTFFLLLRDRLYLIYTVYVFFSGMLQFSLEGYAHQFLLPSGGYFTQHIVLFVAGWTVFFAYYYSASYLELTGRLRRTAQILALLVVLATFASLIPGTVYEICYPLINGFSLLSLVFILYSALTVRKRSHEVSNLFLFGLISLMGGAIIFILGNFSLINIPILTQNSLKVGTLIEIICLSILMAGKYKRLQDEKDAVQKQLFIELEEKNKVTEEANIRLEAEVQARTEKIDQQRAQLKEKNEDLLDSIKYAKRIQQALLPPEKQIKKWLPNSFVFYEPKDIVSGDFYWMEEVQTSTENPERLLLFATADCTGHGVPGALVSVVCNNLLKMSKIQREINSTGEALDFIDHEIFTLLNSEYRTEHIRDGMDISLCALNRSTNKLYFSSAKIPLYLIRNGELKIFKGDRKSIGYVDDEQGFHYKTEVIQLEKGDCIYSFSDGIVDQFGGEKGKKFLAKRLQNLLLEICELPMEEQKKRLSEVVTNWKENYEQIDDMLLIGITV